MKHGKKYRAVSEKIDRNKIYSIEKAVKLKRRHEPNPECASAYNERFIEHQNLVHVMQEAWERLGKL